MTFTGCWLTCLPGWTQCRASSWPAIGVRGVSVPGSCRRGDASRVVNIKQEDDRTMRLVTFASSGVEHYGVQAGDSFIDLAAALHQNCVNDIEGLMFDPELT